MTTATATMPRLSEPNSKLGSVWGWSIPAVKTCPGATSACMQSCYAKRGNFAFPKVMEFFASNLEAAESPHFIDNMVSLIMAKGCRTFRIHISGDFYSAEYIKKWTAIITAVNEKLGHRGEFCTFYFYTRSWRIPKLLPHIRTLGRLPHVHAWLSADRTSGTPPKVKWARVAYMSASDDESRQVAQNSLDSAKPDLIFRACRKKTVIKKVGPSAVCPAENGQAKKVTCDMCRLCWKGFSSPRTQEKE